MMDPPVQIPPIFEKFSDFLGNSKNLTFSRKNFPFSSAKISDDLLLVIGHKFRVSPILPVLVHFPPDSRKFIISSPTFQNFPLFSKNSTAFYILYVYFPPTLTMMHLCITQCTSWTPLIVVNPQATKGVVSTPTVFSYHTCRI